MEKCHSLDTATDLSRRTTILVLNSINHTLLNLSSHLSRHCQVQAHGCHDQPVADFPGRFAGEVLQAGRGCLPLWQGEWLVCGYTSMLVLTRETRSYTGYLLRFNSHLILIFLWRLFLRFLHPSPSALPFAVCLSVFVYVIVYLK